MLRVHFIYAFSVAICVVNDVVVLYFMSPSAVILMGDVAIKVGVLTFVPAVILVPAMILPVNVGLAKGANKFNAVCVAFDIGL